MLKEISACSELTVSAILLLPHGDWKQSPRCRRTGLLASHMTARLDTNNRMPTDIQ